MDIKIIKFDDTEIEKYKFHQYKSPISLLIKMILNILLAINLLKK